MKKFFLGLATIFKAPGLEFELSSKRFYSFVLLVWAIVYSFAVTPDPVIFGTIMTAFTTIISVGAITKS